MAQIIDNTLCFPRFVHMRCPELIECKDKLASGLKLGVKRFSDEELSKMNWFLRFCRRNATESVCEVFDNAIHVQSEYWNDWHERFVDIADKFTRLSGRWVVVEKRNELSMFSDY